MFKDILLYSPHTAIIIFILYRVGLLVLEYLKNRKKKEEEKNSSTPLFNFNNIINNDNNNENKNHNSNISDKKKFTSNENFRYLLYFLLEQGKIHNVLHNMKSDILYKQLCYLESQLDGFKSYVFNNLSEKILLIENINIYHTQYLLHAENFLELCISEIVDRFRTIYKENHFSNSTKLEFEDIAEQKSFYMMEEIKRIIKKRYPEILIQSKVNLELNDLRPKFMGIIKECLYYARDISIEKKEYVNKLKEKFEMQIYDLTGIKYNLEI